MHPPTTFGFKLALQPDPFKSIPQFVFFYVFDIHNKLVYSTHKNRFLFPCMFVACSRGVEKKTPWISYMKNNMREAISRLLESVRQRAALLCLLSWRSYCTCGIRAPSRVSLPLKWMTYLWSWVRPPGVSTEGGPTGSDSNRPDPSSPRSSPKARVKVWQHGKEYSFSSTQSQTFVCVFLKVWFRSFYFHSGTKYSTWLPAALCSICFVVDLHF